MKKVVIIYGTSGGNTEIVCQKIADVLRSRKMEVELRRVEQCSAQDVLTGDLCILAAPTYEHGIIQYHFLPFLKELRKIDLRKHKMAVVGLGDPSYDMHYHIESANTLTDAITDANGALVGRPLRVSGLPFGQLETRVAKWAEELAA